MFFLFLNILHIFNDGYKASLLLLLPFIAKDMHLNLTTVGFLAMVANSLTTFLALPSGYFSERFGGMKILLLSLFMYAVGFILLGFSHSLWLLTFLFFFTALGFGAFHTISYALVAAKTTAEERGKQMGEYTAWGDVGKIGISSIVTSLVAWIGWHTGAILFGGAALGLGFVGQLIPKMGIDVHPHQQEQKTQKAISYKHILKDKSFLLVNMSSVFDNFASSALFIFIPFLLLQRHIPLSLVGLFTALFFVGNISGKTLLSRVLHRFGNEKVFIASEICMAISIVLLSNTSYIPFIVVMSIILGMFTKGTSPIIATMVSQTADGHGGYDKTFALNNMTTGIATMIAPVLLGFFSDRLGVVSAFDVAAVFAILAIFPAVAIRKFKPVTAVELATLEESE